MVLTLKMLDSTQKTVGAFVEKPEIHKTPRIVAHTCLLTWKRPWRSGKL